jgi:hypothetical protein
VLFEGVLGPKVLNSVEQLVEVDSKRFSLLENELNSFFILEDFEG